MRTTDWLLVAEMKQNNLHAVTGAFGYSGKYITHRLLAAGESVITLTNSLHRQNPFGDRVKAVPFHFDEPGKLTEALDGVSVLYNTYWVRFNHPSFTHADAVRNTQALFQAAKAAGVKRVEPPRVQWRLSCLSPSSSTRVCSR